MEEGSQAEGSRHSRPLRLVLESQGFHQTKVTVIAMLRSNLRSTGTCISMHLSIGNHCNTAHNGTDDTTNGMRIIRVPSNPHPSNVGVQGYSSANWSNTVGTRVQGCSNQASHGTTKTSSKQSSKLCNIKEFIVDDTPDHLNNQ